MSVDRAAVRSIFLAAVDLEGEARRAYLDSSCEGALREEVESLLADQTEALAEAETPSEAAEAAPGSTPPLPRPLDPGQRRLRRGAALLR